MEGEDLLIDLERSGSEKVEENPPLIPAPSNIVTVDNNPFDAVAELTKEDPFEMVFLKAVSKEDSKNENIEVRYDLISLNDSDEKNSSTNKKSPNHSKTVNLVVSNADPRNISHSEDSQNYSFFSPTTAMSNLQISQHRTFRKSPNEGDEIDSKKSSTSINISALSSLHCISENSNNELESSVFLVDTLPSEQNIKEFAAARIQSVIKKTLNKSFAGFDRNEDQTALMKLKSRRCMKSLSTDDGPGSIDEKESQVYSDYSTNSYGSMNQGFLKTSGNLTPDSTPSVDPDVLSNDTKTSISTKKDEVISSLFHVPPVEILREAKRLSRSFSLGSSDYANLVDNIEDLRSIKPKWEALDSSSDEDCSDDSLKSLSLNIRNTSNYTPPKRTPDSEALKKFKKRLSLLSSAGLSTEKESPVKQRSRSADRSISDSALKSLTKRTFPVNLHSALPVSKLEDVKLRHKNPEPDVNVKRGPMKALVPLKNMLRGKDASSSSSKIQKPVAKSPRPKSPESKKSAIKPAAASTPKRNRKPLAENNAQNSHSTNQPNNSVYKIRRSSSYELKNSTPDTKSTYRSSSASRVGGGIKPPTPVSKLPGLTQGSPVRTREEYNTTPKKRIATSTPKVRQNLYSGKENINRI